MKKILFAILLIISSEGYAQNGKYEYFPIEGYEAFEIQKDTFTYFLYGGLIRSETKGVISVKEDSLILNSIIQPKYSLASKFDNSLNTDIFKVCLNFNTPEHLSPLFSYGLRLQKNGQTEDLNLLDSNSIHRFIDTAINQTCYLINTEILTHWDEFYFIRYRTNLTIPLKWKNPNYNQFELEFTDSIYYLDYHFFTNQKAVIIKDELILIDKSGNPEKTRIVKRRNGKVRISKKEKTKIYKKASYKKLTKEA